MMVPYVFPHSISIHPLTITSLSQQKGLYTNKLLTYLNSNDLKATFFLVGPRVITHPEIVVYEHMNGHELGQTQSKPATHSYLLTFHSQASTLGPIPLSLL